MNTRIPWISSRQGYITSRIHKIETSKNWKLFVRVWWIKWRRSMEGCYRLLIAWINWMTRLRGRWTLCRNASCRFRNMNCLVDYLSLCYCLVIEVGLKWGFIWRNCVIQHIITHNLIFYKILSTPFTCLGSDWKLSFLAKSSPKGGSQAQLLHRLCHHSRTDKAIT